MARPMKQGLDYYPVDINFLKDLKVRRIIRACGPAAPTVLISLLSNIYANHGYYVLWDGDMPFLIADDVGVSEGLVNEVVNKALQVAFFDEALFKAYKLLSSCGIQKRYMEATIRRTRVDMYAAYLLINDKSQIPEHINLVNVGINPQNADSNTQSKGKKSKGKKSTKTPVSESGSAEVSAGYFAHESVPYKAAKYLAEKILLANPKAKVPKDDEGLYKWCIPMDRLLRLDQKPSDELRDVLSFAVKDAFWSTNILSAESFREKYDQLYAKMKMQQNQRLSAENKKQGEAPKNRFCNFEQRKNDYDTLEKKERAYLQDSLQSDV